MNMNRERHEMHEMDERDHFPGAGKMVWKPQPKFGEFYIIKLEKQYG